MSPSTTHDGETVLWVFDLTSLNTREGQAAWCVTCPMNGKSCRELVCQQAQGTLANGNRQDLKNSHLLQFLCLQLSPCLPRALHHLSSSQAWGSFIPLPREHQNPTPHVPLTDFDPAMLLHHRVVEDKMILKSLSWCEHIVYFVFHTSSLSRAQKEVRKPRTLSLLKLLYV